MFGSILDFHRRLQESRSLTVALVYLSLLLDNTLLTMVVPIIPDYLYRIENGGPVRTSSRNASLQLTNTSRSRLGGRTLGLRDVTDENDQVGTLLSSKAFVQLLANGAVGTLASRVGYGTPLLLGMAIVSTSAFTFALAETYGLLLAARSIQGLGSACLAVSGMAIVAERYTDDSSRSRAMGVAMGGSALGVLAGYPLGSTLYDFVGKTAPFLIVAIASLILTVLQATVLGNSCSRQPEESCPALPVLVINRYVFLTIGAIWVSTTAMAVLEPCLPLWLMEELHPSRWQLGTVFIPDSLGYLLGTNFFASFALRAGRWLTATLALILVGVCAVTIPFSTHMLHLLVPHFGLGLGIGITDAALMPLLAHLVDSHLSGGRSSYAGVYALAQTAVCLAYSLGPLLGGYLVESLGFPWVIRTVGIMNLAYAPLCLLLRNNGQGERKMLLPGSTSYQAFDAGDEQQRAEGRTSYTRFHNSPEAEQ